MGIGLGSVEIALWAIFSFGLLLHLNQPVLMNCSTCTWLTEGAMESIRAEQADDALRWMDDWCFLIFLF